MAENNGKVGLGAIMMIAGGIIGAGLALLYAPQSGARTRRQMARCARKVRNEAEETIRVTANSINGMVDELTEKTSDLLERGGDVAEDWRRHLLDALESGQKELEKQRRRLSQQWEKHQ
jgi:gas vesicle protein